ncbi:hypothetical protein LAZ67_18001952 [Cordylochernes scorpioides]|uniref:Uncharacterized protein n=1 Tax=Cordylochernes scorpioides TaxID=51811 RepID=A0ABY6LH41_9ARAC|nr:hypothetical protein LAZ67_18001952 [Cordylochernes scorpioides]
MVKLSELSYYRYCRITVCYLIGRRLGHWNMVELSPSVELGIIKDSTGGVLTISPASSIQKRCQIERLQKESCWGNDLLGKQRIPITVTIIFFFFLISTQSYQSIKLVELVDGTCLFFLISTQLYQGIKLLELVDGVCRGRVEFINGRVNTVNNVF